MVVLAFTLEPPGHTIGGGSGVISWSTLSRFVIVVLNGLALIAAISFGGRAHLRYWVAASVLSLVAGSILLGSYGYMVLQWTCETMDGFRLVIGTTLLSKAAAYTSAGHEQCGELLQAFATNPLFVWERSAVFQREIELGWIFVASISALGVGMISLLQSYKIVSKEEIIRRHLAEPEGAKQ